MGFFKKSDKEIRIIELNKMIRKIKERTDNPYLSKEEMDQYRFEIEEIKKEIEELTNS